MINKWTFLQKRRAEQSWKDTRKFLHEESTHVDLQ